MRRKIALLSLGIIAIILLIAGLLALNALGENSANSPILLNKNEELIDKETLNSDFNKAFDKIAIASASKLTLNFDYLEDCCKCEGDRCCDCYSPQIAYYEIEIQNLDMIFLNEAIEQSMASKFAMGYTKKSDRGALILTDNWDGTIKRVPLKIFIWQDNGKVKIIKSNFADYAAAVFLVESYKQ
ncbi:MAG: hypothetical protein V1493_04300 [Candidatus Diapherotrites archaeon]